MSQDRSIGDEGELSSKEDAPAIEDPGTYITEDGSPYTAADGDEADRAAAAAREQSDNTSAV